MGVTACAVLLPQEVRLFLGVVQLLKEAVDPLRPALKVASARKGLVNLVLRDKGHDGGQFRQGGAEGLAGQVQFLQAVQHTTKIVVVKAHDRAIFLIGSEKCPVFGQQSFSEVWVCQKVGKAGLIFRKVQPFCSVGQAGKEIIRVIFPVQVTVQIDQAFRQTAALIPICLQQFHVAGKLASLQQLSDALGHTLPGDDLGVGFISGTISMGKVDAVLVIPCGHGAVLRSDTVAAVIEGLEAGGHKGQGNVHLKQVNHPHPQLIRIAAVAQELVNRLLSNKKSGGCRQYILRFRRCVINLFRWGDQL